MMSLYSLTLDNVCQKLPEAIIEDLKKKVINENYKPDAKILKIIVGIDNHNLLTQTGHTSYYWFYKILPDLFDMYQVNHNNREPLIQQAKNNTSDDPIVVLSYGSFIFDKNKDKLFNFWKFLHRNFWHEISQKFYERMPAEISSYYIFKDFREDLGIMETSDRLIVIWQMPEYGGDNFCSVEQFKLQEMRSILI